MTKLEELSHLINVRNHLSLLLNGTRNVIKKSEVPAIGAVIQKMDAEIVREALSLEATVPSSQDEVDIQKKVAEAKAKIASLKMSAPKPQYEPKEPAKKSSKSKKKDADTSQ